MADFFSGLASGLESGFAAADKRKQTAVENKREDRKLQMQEGEYAMKKEAFEIEKKAAARKAAADEADAQAAAAGGLSGWLAHKERTDPKAALEVRKAKATLDGELLKNEGATYLNKKQQAEYLEKGYSVIGNFGRVILNEKDPATQAELYKSALPTLQQLVPEAPANYDNRAKAMLQLGLGQAIPANKAFEADQEAKKLSTDIGQTIDDWDKTRTKFGADSEEAKKIERVLNDKVLEQAEKKTEALDKKLDMSGKAEDVLRKEWLTLNRDFIVIRDAYNKIKTSGTGKPTVAGDLALTYNFIKILDATSSVREGERADIDNAGGVPAQIRMLYNKTLMGKTGLSDEVRRDILDRSQKLFDAQRRGYSQQKTEYIGMAQRRNLDPRNIIVDLETKNTEAENKQQELAAIPDSALVKQHAGDAETQKYITKFQQVNPNASAADAIRYKLMKDLQRGAKQ